MADPAITTQPTATPDPACAAAVFAAAPPPTIQPRDAQLNAAVQPDPGMFMREEPSILSYLTLPWKRSFDFKGRSGRKEYWAFASVALIVYALLFGVLFERLGSVSASAAYEGTSPFDSMAVGIVAIGILLWWAILLLTGTALAIRRLHDMNQSGWLYSIFIPLYLLMPYFAWIGLIVIGCVQGTRGYNNYGADPNGNGVGDVFG